MLKFQVKCSSAQVYAQVSSLTIWQRDMQRIHVHFPCDSLLQSKRMIVHVVRVIAVQCQHMLKFSTSVTQRHLRPCRLGWQRASEHQSIHDNYHDYDCSNTWCFIMSFESPPCREERKHFLVSVCCQFYFPSNQVHLTAYLSQYYFYQKTSHSVSRVPAMQQRRNVANVLVELVKGDLMKVAREMYRHWGSWVARRLGREECPVDELKMTEIKVV